MRVPVALLACLMLITGSINTISTKLQDGVQTGTDSATGKPILFKHPAVQTAFMFAGEALCLIPFFISEHFKNRENPSPRREERKSPSFWRKTFLAFTIPALCDAGATTLLNLGLYYTYASVFQMLRGTLVVFAGCLTIILLKRKLRSHNWIGIALITAGAALVGASSIVYEKEDSKEAGHIAAPNPLLGNLLVILAQLLNSTQFIVEEKFLKALHPPVLLAVGIEGIVGMLICSVALPILSFLPGPGSAPIDDPREAIAAIAASSTLQWTTLLTVFSIAAFNFCGVSVTKRLSGASRAAIDACRTAVVWLFCIRVGWEKFHFLQVVGFAILITGTSVYNDILRSCMPLPPPVAHSHRHRSRRRHRAGASDQEDPLLGTESDSEEEGIITVNLPFSARLEDGNESGLQHSSADATDITVYSPSSGATSGEVPSDEGAFNLHQPPVIVEEAANLTFRPPLPQAIPRSSAMATGRGGVTMARSVTFLPGILSPHSLASVPSSDLLYLQSVASESGLGSTYAEGTTGASSVSSEEGSVVDEEEGRSGGR